MLDVSALTIRYDSSLARAVEDVSFSITAGEAVGLLGESGCGKTSIALAILGLLPPHADVSGSIRLAGRELRHCPESALQPIRGAQISIVFQEPELSLHPLISVGDQVADVICAHRSVGRRRAREQARGLLAEVGLEGHPAGRMASAYPHELSGGERQRVAIAQALACRPALLIADEPTASLDTTVQAEILTLIRHLQRRRGLALLFISHNPAVLGTVADRLLVMSAGRIVETGPAARILQRPVAPYTRTLLACVPQPARATGRTTRPASERPLVEVRRLHKTYRPRRFFSANRAAVLALHGVDFSIDSQTTVALVGASGSGKSTLAHCLARLEDPDSGEIWFDGIDVARRRGRALRPYRRQVQVIFQDAAAALNPALTAQEIVAEPMVIQHLGSRPERRERALDLLDQVGLPRARASALPSELSGGQRHRLAVARALGLTPSLLILDEAFSGLDLRVQQQLLDLLRTLQARHSLTYLCISHDLALVSAFADDIAVMHDGRIVERDRAAALFHRQRHPQSRALVASMPRLAPFVAHALQG